MRRAQVREDLECPCIACWTDRRRQPLATVLYHVRNYGAAPEAPLTTRTMLANARFLVLQQSQTMRSHAAAADRANDFSNNDSEDGMLRSGNDSDGSHGLESDTCSSDEAGQGNHGSLLDVLEDDAYVHDAEPSNNAPGSIEVASDRCGSACPSDDSVASSSCYSYSDIDAESSAAQLLDLQTACPPLPQLQQHQLPQHPISQTMPLETAWQSAIICQLATHHQQLSLCPQPTGGRHSGP